VCETSTSPAPALEATREPMVTARPATLPSCSSHSPTWMPIRASRPSVRTPFTIASAALIARAGAVEGGEEPVAGGVVLVAAVASEFTSDDRVVACEQVTPSAIADPHSVISRADDVGEHDGRQHGLGDERSFFAGDESLDLVCDLVGEENGGGVGAGDAHRLRARDPRRHIHRRGLLLRQGAVEEKRRDVHRGQHIAQTPAEAYELGLTPGTRHMLTRLGEGRSFDS
jgi:hypothetical protein